MRFLDDFDIARTNNTTFYWLEKTVDFSASRLFVGKSIHETARIFFSTFCIVMILCGVSGSALLLTVILRRFLRNRHVHDLFLANLTVVDLLFLGYWLPFLVLDLQLEFHPVVNRVHCAANGMIMVTLNEVCVLTLLGISFNRYLHVCYSRSRLFRSLFTLSRTVLIIVCIWALSILTALPPALKPDGRGYDYDPFSHVCTFDHGPFTYIKGTVIFFSFVLMISIGVWNWAIFRFWKKSNECLEMWNERAGRCGSLSGGGEKGVEDATEIQITAYQTATADRQIEKDQTPLSGEYEDITISTMSESTISSVFPFRERNIDNVGLDLSRPDNDMDSLSFAEPTFVDTRQIMQEEDEECPEATLASPDKDILTQSPEDQQQDENDQRCQEKPTSREVSNPCGTPVCTEAYNPCGTPASTEVYNPCGTPVSTEAYNPCGTPVSTEVHNPCGISAPTDRATPPTKPASLAPPSLGAKLSRSFTALASIWGKWSPQRSQTSQRNMAYYFLRQKKQARDVALVRSLFIVWLLTIICFVPFMTILIVSTLRPLAPEIKVLGVVLLLFNNSVNWIVYGVMNPSYRKAYMKCGRPLGACCQGR